MVDKPNVDWQPLEDAYPYVYLGSAVTKDQRRDVEHSMGLMIAIGIGTEGYQHLLGVAEGEHADPADWRGFMNQLKARGLDGVRLVNGTVPVRALEVVGQCFPDAQTQLCVAHWYRTVLADVPPDKRVAVTRLLKGIHAAGDRQAAFRRARDVSKKLTELQLRKAATVVRETVKHTATYYAFPSSHWHLIRTNNPLDRVRRELRSRIVAARELPEATSLTWLVAGWLQHISSTKWNARRYLAMEGVESVLTASSGLSKTA